MIETLTDSHFWLTSLTPIALIALPIMLVGKATPFRSFLASTVIYIAITLLSACNVPGPF